LRFDEQLKSGNGTVKYQLIRSGASASLKLQPLLHFPDLARSRLSEFRRTHS